MKKILLLIFSFCSAVTLANQADEMVEYASKLLGSSYKYGAEGPRSFDCSGFTRHVFGKFGYTLNRTSASQYDNGVSIKKKNVQKGDLIFFKGSRVSSPSIGHVGIVVSEKGESPIRFIHASVSSGVCIDNLESDYYSRRFVGVVRVLDEKVKSETEEEFPHSPALNAEDNETTSSLEYVVKQGDTMYSISRKYQCSLDELRKSNGMANNDIKVGQVLKIPAQPFASAAESAAVADETTAEKSEVEIVVNDKPLSSSRDTIVHIVKKGETLYRISKRYNCTPDQIRQWNNLENHIISVGQELKLLFSDDF